MAVAHLVYVAAFALDDGESVWGLASSMPDPVVPAMTDALVVHDEVITVSSLAAATQAFYGRCDPDVAHAAYQRLSAQHAASLRQTVRGNHAS